MSHIDKEVSLDRQDQIMEGLVFYTENLRAYPNGEEESKGEFRQKNDNRTSAAFDCLVSCLVTNPIFSPSGTLFLPTLNLHDSVRLIPFLDSRLNTAYLQSK